MGAAWTPDDLRWGALALAVVGKSTLILVAAGAVVLLPRCSSAAVRHGVWTMALAAALALPLFSALLPSWSWPVLPSAAAPFTPPIPSTPPAATESFPAPDRFAPRPPGPSAMRPATIAAPAPVRAAPASLSTTPPVRPSRPVWPWVAGLWLLGAFIVLSAPLCGRFLLGRTVRRAMRFDVEEWPALKVALGVRRRVELYQGGRSQMPMTWGMLRPAVLVPDEFGDWTPERRRDVLVHELAHVRRFDCFTQAAAQLACAVYWFNPLVWIAAARMRIERERACDDVVLSFGGIPSAYAGSLLEAARALRTHRRAALAAVSMARPSQLEGRLLAILDPSRPRGGIGRRFAVLALLFLPVILAPISTVRLSAQAVNAVEGGGPVPATNGESREETTVVAGRVADPDGKPIKGAVVDVVGAPQYEWIPAELEHRESVWLGQAETGADGRFQTKFPRTPASRFYDVKAIASAPGAGLGWREVNLDAKRPNAEIQLRAEQPVRVKLVDVAGIPAPGVEVRVKTLIRENGVNIYEWAGMGGIQPENVRAWPGPMKTDDQGVFVLRGLPRGFTAVLITRDMRFARQELFLKAEGDGEIKNAVLALKPARIIEGRVIAADDGRAIPNAVVTVQAPIDSEQGRGWHTTNFPADDQGRFRVNPPSGDEYAVWAFAPAGEPYLIQKEEFNWPKGAVRLRRDVKLPRGVVIRGKATDVETGRGVGRARVQFIPAKYNDSILSGWQALLTGEDDGSFQIVVPAGKGRILVHVPNSNYVLEEGGRPGRRRMYAHKILDYDVKEGEAVVVAAELTPGKTIRGRVAGPHGETVDKASIISSINILPTNPTWRGDFQTPVRDGRFEIHGAPPDRLTRISILDEDHAWGATVELSGKQADEEVAVTLEPCGQARARFVGPDGKPIAGFMPTFEFVARPGVHEFSHALTDKAAMAADADFVTNVQRKRYWPQPSTDADGRAAFPDLIPGAAYRINDFSTVNDPKIGVQVRKDFTVKPGETVDLGDVLIEEPGRP